MNTLVYCIYLAIVGCIRIYKLLELKLMQLFNPYVKTCIKRKFESAGIVFHCPEETSKNLKRLICDNNELVHIKVNDNQFFSRLLNSPLGLGESFMDKTIDVFNKNYEDLTDFGVAVFGQNIHNIYYNPWNQFLEWLELHAFNLQTVERAFQVGNVHYDLGNDLFESMLDPWMQYTCGYWKDTDNLNDAQVAKMELICKKLQLKPGMRVLDIGCGWGTLVHYMATNFQVECVGVTIGKNGADYGKRMCTGLPVDIRLQDYRELDEKFDRIVSVGMFEHVGHRNHKTFFEVANRCLKEDGLLLLHTIGTNHVNVPRCEPWTDKYIFPNGSLPKPKDIVEKTNSLFVIEDWHNFGQDYAKTLFCWRENFIRAWPKLEMKYGERFFRMWIFYLSAARALFKCRKLQLWQIVLSKDGLREEYRAAR